MVNTLDDLKVTIYPNPTNGILKIESCEGFPDNAVLEIIDYYGRIVYTKVSESPKYQEIDLSHISNGIYLLRIRNNSKYLFQKVVIE